MRLTIILVSRGRPEWLARCILSLNHSIIQARYSGQSIQASLRVMINGNDAESARSASEALAQARALDHTVIQRTLPVTPAQARNELLRGDHSAQTDWVFFIDDDAYVAPEHFSRWLGQVDLGGDVIGGPNLTPPGSDGFAEAIGLALSSRWATYSSFKRYRTVGRGSAQPCDEGALILCNLFVRRACLKDDPFPTALACGEESVMLQNLQRAGARLVYDPELSLFHERRGSTRALTRQVFAYGQGRAYLALRHGLALRLAHVLPSLAVLSIVCLPALGGIWTMTAIASYGAICVIAAAWAAYRMRASSPWIGVRCIFVFPLIHASYGAGFLGGLARVVSEVFQQGPIRATARRGTS